MTGVQTCALPIYCARRRGKQRIDRLVSEANDLIVHEIAADRAVRQPLLIFLIDHPAAAGKVRLAAAIKFAERDALFAAAALRVPDTDNGFAPRRRRAAPTVVIRGAVHRQLNFPYAVAAVAPGLLAHPRLPRRESQRQFTDHLIHTAVKMRVAAPPEIACAKEDFFGPEL